MLTTFRKLFTWAVAIHATFSSLYIKPTNGLVLADNTRCPLPSSKIDFYSSTICWPYEDIISQYHVITNVPSMNEADIIIFAEVHYRKEIRANVALLSTLQKPGDIVLFEGIKADVSFDCEKVLITADNFRLINWPSTPSTTTKPFFQSPHTITCRGWDYLDEANQNQELLQYASQVQQHARKTESLSLLFDKHHALVNALVKAARQTAVSETLGQTDEKLALEIKLKELADRFQTCEIEIYRILFPSQIKKLTLQLKSWLNKLFSLIKSNPLQINEHFDFLKQDAHFIQQAVNQYVYQSLETVNEDAKKIFSGNDREDDQLIKKRNEQGLIKTLTKLSQSKARLFAMTGAAHVFRKNPVDEDTVTLDDVKANHPQFTLREYLLSRRHAIVIHKEIVATKKAP